MGFFATHWRSVVSTALVSTLLVSGSTRVEAAPSGLVAAYSFDDGAGSSAFDASGNGRTGALVAPASLLRIVGALCLAIAIGLPAGLIAGYYAGRFEAVSNWVVSILMSLPGLIVLLTLYIGLGILMSIHRHRKLVQT